MKRIIGYIRTLGQYWKNPKGRHDIGDYFRCIMSLVILAVIVAIIMKLMA